MHAGVLVPSGDFNSTNSAKDEGSMEAISSFELPESMRMILKLHTKTRHSSFLLRSIPLDLT